MTSITIKSPNGPDRVIPISPAMQKHWGIPINSTEIILKQINSGMYEKWFKDKKDLTVIDFGANVGLTALYFLPATSKIMLVEPTPSHQEIQVELLTANAKFPGNWLSFVNHALSDKQGKVVFMTGHSTENKITSADGYGNGKIEVDARPLNWFLSQMGETIDFIKCDIEGAEIFALSQEQINLSKGKVRTFFVECHPSNNYGIDDCRLELVKRFENAGYEVEQLDYQTIVATYDC